MLASSSFKPIYCMKKNFYITLVLLLVCYANLFGQWSVLDTEPVPKQTAFKYQPFTQEEWNASNFATSEQMEWFTNARYGMFIHFGLSAYVEKDISWEIVKNRKAPDSGHGAYPDSVWQTWPSRFKLEKFNADDWVQIAKDAGMKYIVVIAKHHDGFHMWDTKFSDFKITNTPFGRDYLKELADACHRVNMPFGIYYSQRDWYHPDYAPVDTSKLVNLRNGHQWKSLQGGNPIAGASHKKYLEYQRNVVKELLTNYGTVDVFWFDAAWWGGMFNADMWDAENLTRMMRKLQPNIIINNRISVPGDFDTPEQEVGRYQARPWESALTLNGHWAYANEENYSRKRLLRELLSSAQGNGNVLLSWGAHWDGMYNPAQKELLLSMGEWLKKYGNAFYETKGGPWMPGKWGGATHSGNKVYLYIYEWNDHNIALPKIPNNVIVSSKYLNVNEKVKFKIKDDSLFIDAPTQTDSIATLIEFVMNEPITEVIETKSQSVFSGLEFGALLIDRDLKVTEWNKKEYIFDLKKIHNLTGVGIYGTNVPIKIWVSENKQDWVEVGEVNAENSELALTTYLAGAHVLGRNARYIQLKTAGAPKRTMIKVYSK